MTVQGHEPQGKRYHMWTSSRTTGRLAASMVLATVAGLFGCGGQGYAKLTGAERAERIHVMYADYAAQFPGVPDIDVATLLQWQEEKDVLLVDVRSAEEQAVSRIPGAISRSDFEEDKAKYSGRPIVAYCTIGYRSAQYTEELLAQGWDAYNLAGSLLAWAHQGKTFVGPDGEATRRAHVYGAKWNLLPHGFEAVW